METIVKISMALVAVVLIALLMSLPVMWLWNWLMPKIFGLITINCTEALGLSLLGNFLFNSSSNNNN